MNIFIEMSMDKNFLRNIEIRENEDETNSLWTKNKIESGQLIAIIDKVFTFINFIVFY